MEQITSRSAALLFVGAALLWPSELTAGEKYELSDLELDQVTAGGVGDESIEELTAFEFTKTTRSGKTVTAEGSVAIIKAADSLLWGSLSLSDSAQSNLQSLININAVNSPVNVLVNLNINIDSQVGSVRQLNLTGGLPFILPPPRP